MKANFYSSFEDKFRGSRATVKLRLGVYLPFIKPLLGAYPKAQALDLGCGRGEWLELLNENGFSAYGVDINEEMLEPAKALGLTVYCEDAIQFLKKLPDASKLVISAFHIVEHIPFANVELLIQEALRVLVPGGILIIETPNPENIVVGTTNFYLDPTHKHPIPPELLAFLPEYYGFGKFKVLRLQEDNKLTQHPLSLIDVLRGVSPDCAIVAQKKADKAILCLNEKAFTRDYGVTLEQLASTYDRQNAKVLGNIERFIHFFGSSEVSADNQDNLFDKILAVMQESESNRTELLQQIEELTALLKTSESDRLARAKQIDELTILLKESLAERAACLTEIQRLTLNSRLYKFLRVMFAKRAEMEPSSGKYALLLIKKCLAKLRVKGIIRKTL